MAMASTGMGVAWVGLGRAGVYTMCLVEHPSLPAKRRATHLEAAAFEHFLCTSWPLPPRPDLDYDYEYYYYNYNNSCCDYSVQFGGGSRLAPAVSE